jgi:hypothetical protein
MVPVDLLLPVDPLILLDLLLPVDPLIPVELLILVDPVGHVGRVEPLRRLEQVK